MANSLPTRCFISYSRQDSDFVDRLEADLRARGFETWVDRRRLEGAQNFEQEIYRAIDWGSLMLVVLSPAAAASSAVALEYRYALGKNKVVIPVIWRYCQMPSELEKIQWVDFQAGDHAAGLKALLIAIADLADQRTSLPTDSRELYKQAIDARQRNDLERASILLQRLVDREPDYANGEAARDLKAVSDRLYPERAQRLRQEAVEARRKGEYGREAGALEALVALGGQEPWAQEYLPFAQQNRKQLELYDAVQEYMDRGDPAEARAKMTRLWAGTPYFGDPAGVARKLGLSLPRTYEDDKERKQASDWKQQAEANAHADLDRATNDENQQWSQLQTATGIATGNDPELLTYRQCKQLAETETEIAHRRQGQLDNWHWFSYKGALGVLIYIVVISILGGSIVANSPGMFSLGLTFILFLVGILSPLWLWYLLFASAARHRRQATQAEDQANNWYAQWHKRREQEQTYKLQQLQGAYQQRMRDVETEYQQRLERITRKYAASS